jgi:uncharacterized protein
MTWHDSSPFPSNAPQQRFPRHRGHDPINGPARSRSRPGVTIQRIPLLVTPKHAQPGAPPSATVGFVVKNRRPPRGAGRQRVAALLLAPGAGASSDSPAFVEFTDAIGAAGVLVERMDFPYRLAGRRRPDVQSVLEQSVRERACELANDLGVGTDQLVLGGRSMGGRICSQVVAAGLPAAGLALVSYPLHPPGRADRLRTSHFPALKVPCLFVSGTRDAFGTRTELEDATAVLAGPVSHVWLEGGDHGLRRRASDASAAVVQWLADTFVLVGAR